MHVHADGFGWLCHGDGAGTGAAVNDAASGCDCWRPVVEQAPRPAVFLSKTAGEVQKLPQKVRVTPDMFSHLVDNLSEEEKAALWKDNHSARQREASERAEAGCVDRLALNPPPRVGESPVQQVMTLPSDPVDAADDMAVRQMLNRIRGFQGLSVSCGGDRIVGTEGMSGQGRE